MFTQRCVFFSYRFFSGVICIINCSLFHDKMSSYIGESLEWRLAIVDQNAPERLAALLPETRLSQKTDQIIAVIANGNRATITLLEKVDHDWLPHLSTEGFVGANGVGPTREGLQTTPQGVHPLGFAFGTENPGTALPFRMITPCSWWVEDSEDPQYNTWQEGETFKAPSEHMADYPELYRYGIVINYNRERIPYAGSGFFVHCSGKGPTAGCVSLPTEQMKRLMQQLRPGAYIVTMNDIGELGDY
jgi:L,D-peptidoglycan transpeptidase YkuD (ErfK/YbiS/YcfS/YnhG family)